LQGWKIYRCLPWLLAALMLISGCSGILLESKDQSGGVEHLRIDTAESWSTHDDRPRQPYISSGRHGLDDMSIMFKGEKSF
jgi:hypothetical protein